MELEFFKHLKVEDADLGGKRERFFGGDPSVCGDFEDQSVVVGVLANAGVFDEVVDEAHRGKCGVDDDLVDDFVRDDMPFGGDVASADRDLEIDSAGHRFGDGEDRVVGLKTSKSEPLRDLSG